MTPTATGASISFTVTNTGKRVGADVAQVYVGDPPAAGEPPHQLKGYARVKLNPGHNETVTIPLDQRAFSIWDSASQSWTVTPGCYSISVGDSSRSLPLSASIGRGGGAC